MFQVQIGSVSSQNVLCVSWEGRIGGLVVNPSGKWSQLFLSEEFSEPQIVDVFLSQRGGGNTLMVYLSCLVSAGQLSRIFFWSLMDASHSNRVYSDLSITTTREPLSGLVIIISSRFFSCWIDRASVFDGLGPLFYVVQSYRAEGR